MFEFNATTKWILGRPNFACASLAEYLRRSGHTIARKAEDEQAAVIYWMLSLYVAHGDNWRIEANKLLKSGRIQISDRPR